MPSPHHTLIVSDTHLSRVCPDGVQGTDYRKRAALFDDELAHLIDRAIVRSRNATLEIALNGDLFDFDAPPVPTSSRAALPDARTHEESGAVLEITGILRDHPAIVRALGRALHSGNRVVFVSGNHDAQLVFQGVRDAVSEILSASANLYGGYRDSVVFRSLFHRTPDGVHIEHGHAYDPFCVLDVPLPYVDGHTTRLENTIGSVVSYHAPAALPDLCPYDADPFGLRPKELVKSVLSRVTTGDIDAARCADATTKLVHELSRVEAARSDHGMQMFCEIVADESGVHRDEVAQHVSMFAQKAGVDHLANDETWANHSADLDRRAREVMRKIASIYECRGVVFGHTHVPWADESGGVFYANAGSWVPAGCDRTATGTYAWVESDVNGIRCSVRQYDNGMEPL